MRERIARAVSALFVTSLFALSVLFGGAQNAEPAVGTVPAVPAGAAAVREAPSAADTVRGRLVYEESGCSRCHSVGGVGNARNPLDGVGSRRTPEALLAWTVGDSLLLDSLPPSAFRAKQANREIPAADLEALLAFLSGLVDGASGRLP